MHQSFVENRRDLKLEREKAMNTLLQKLSGGDLRSDGRANEVAEEVD